MKPLSPSSQFNPAWHAKGSTNVIGALIGKLLLTVGLFKTNINADIFYQWTVQDLLPKLPSESAL
jgi:hypothetical protein